MSDTTLALSLPIQGVASSDGIDLAKRAADWGYEACWVSEVQGPDAFTQLGALAVATDLELGVAVVPVQTRATFVLGMSAITISELTGGRFHLGLGASSEVIVTRWAGVPFESPLRHVRESVEALRPILRGDRASYEGRFVVVDGYRPHTTPPGPVPLWIGALNPKSLRQSGEIADGVCLNQFGPQHLPGLLEPVRAGIAAAEREVEIGPDGFGVMARLFCAVTDDLDGARGMVKAAFAPYIATSVYNRYYRSLGYEEEAEGVAAAAANGDRDGMVTAVSDRLVDEVFVLGDAGAVAERVHAYAAAGVTVAAVQPLAPDVEAAADMLRAIAERW